jgi:biopolymer transport protein ExbD
MASSEPDEQQVLSQINVTPLVDVLLVLLLVLMVSASAAVARSLDVKLPSAASGLPSSSTLTLQVDAAGVWRMAGQVLSPGLLRQRLQSLGPPDAIQVVIAADGAAEHRHVIRTLDVLREAGVFKVAFAVQEQGGSP